MSSGDSAARLRDLVILAFICIAVLAGGSSRIVAMTLPVQAAALVALAAVALTARGRGIDRQATVGLGFLLVLAVTIAVQLVPLPAAWWRVLPGRDTAVAIRDLAGAGNEAFPFSLDPDATWRSGFALLIPCAAFLGTAVADASARRRLIFAVVALAAFDLLLSSLQFAARGTNGLIFYDTLHFASAIGVFANRNHNADLLLIAPLLAAAWAALISRAGFEPLRRPIMLIALALFLVGVVTTASRAGLVLAVLPVLGVMVLLGSDGLGRRRGWRSLLPVLAAGAAMVFGLAVLASTNAVTQRVLARFGNTDDQRFSFWADALYAARQYWPVGAGSGTFPTVFQSVERLSIVTEFYVNHAHNEYLELVVELGLWGVLLVAAFLLWLTMVAMRRLRRQHGRPLDPAAFAAMLSIMLLLLHSLVDYPLRTPALAAVFGLLCGLLLDPARGSTTTEDHAP